MLNPVGDFVSFNTILIQAKSGLVYPTMSQRLNRPHQCQSGCRKFVELADATID